MITRLTNGDVELSVRPPLIYLDHWAVRAISSSPARRGHFLEIFGSRGTLMVSVFNIAEMAQNSGASYGAIRDLLDGVGPHWLFIESDPATVQRRLSAGLLPPVSFLGSLQILALIYQSLPVGTCDLGSALHSLHDAEFRERVAKMLARPALLEDLLHSRARHRRGDRMARNSHPKGSPMWIAAELLRYLVKDGKNIEPNDCIDLLHAIVPLYFASVVLLEKAWTSFAHRMRLRDVHVFASPNLDQALEVLRTVDVSRFRELRPDPPLVIKAS